MADTWGTLELNLQTYTIPEIQTNLTEKPLLPAYDAHTTNAANSVLMGYGRGSRVRKVSGYCSIEEYNSLESDCNRGVIRLVSFHDGFSMNAIINNLSKEMKPGSQKQWYSLEFIEV